MPAAMTRLAQSPVFLVASTPASGSMAALDSANSAQQAAKTSSRRSARRRRTLSRVSPGVPARSASTGGGARSEPRIAASAANAGTHSAAVSQNTAAPER